MTEKTTCLWTTTDYEYWDTACENAFTFSAGGPCEDGIDFCPYCGLKIKPQHPEEEEEEEEA